MCAVLLAGGPARCSQRRGWPGHTSPCAGWGRFSVAHLLTEAAAFRNTFPGEGGCAQGLAGHLHRLVPNGATSKAVPTVCRPPELLQGAVVPKPREASSSCSVNGYLRPRVCWRRSIISKSGASGAALFVFLSSLLLLHSDSQSTPPPAHCVSLSLVVTTPFVCRQLLPDRLTCRRPPLSACLLPANRDPAAAAAGLPAPR